ncbi:CsiV family protein [Ferrimonas pelagia]|uniref:Peptidoglycan binding protein CsiV n=1 Tax=Ferrimonas pelagia TaxID=1177826 RepID=A0ABP9EYP1_9GAMM
MKTRICALLMAAVACTAGAEQATWFEVELLIFNRDNQSQERFPEEQLPLPAIAGQDLLGPVWMPDLSGLQQTLNTCSATEWLEDPAGCDQRRPEIISSVPAQLPIQAVANRLGDPRDGHAYLLTEDRLEFDGQARQLRQQGKRILLHTGWQMPVYSRRNAQPLMLYGGVNYGEQFNRDGHQRQLETQPEFARFNWFNSLLPRSQAPEPVWQLDGWLNIYLDHFLFIEARLDLRQPGERVWHGEERIEQDTLLANEPTATAPAVVELEHSEPYLFTINLDQNRRVRSREVHYFDHPQMGLVIQIRRMEQPKPEEEEEETLALPTNR